MTKSVLEDVYELGKWLTSVLNLWVQLAFQISTMSTYISKLRHKLVKTMGKRCTNSEMEELKTFKQQFKKKKLTHAAADNFIVRYIAYMKETKQETIKNDDRMDIDPRRVIFVSLIGFFRTYQQCPLNILYTCFLLMPLKREWIYYPSKYKRELSSELISKLSLFNNTVETKLFMELLKFKDKQGLVFWMKDEYDDEPLKIQHVSALFNPMWAHLSEALMRLYDPITKSHYNEIHLDEEWWENKKKTDFKYGATSALLLNELYFAPLKFKCIQEIIYQSNPNTLIPMISYTENINFNCGHFMHTVNNQSHLYHLYDDFDFDSADDEHNWWISDDYDPYQ